MVLKCKTVNWSSVRDKVKKEQWAAAIVNSLKAAFNNHLKLYPLDPPLEPSAWSHYYFCTKCASRLKYDINRPHEHICPSCCHIYSGDPYDSAWRKFTHGTILTNLERAAILANLSEDGSEYNEYIRKTLLFYSDNYHKYEIHGKHVGKGKVYPQCLSEAIFIIAIERILRFVCELRIFSESELLSIGENFFKPAVELIKPQINMIHNIHAWMQGSLAAAANFLEDKSLLDFSINSEFGWRKQVEKGVTDEGLWYEIAPTYHFYTISALLSTAWIALENDIDLFTDPKFNKMSLTGAAIAYPGGELPAYNDGWFGLNLLEYDSIYEQFTITKNPSILQILSGIYADTKAKPCSTLHSLPDLLTAPAAPCSRSSLAALLYGRPSLPAQQPPEKKSMLLPGSGLGILQNNNLRVGLKFTPDCGMHDHHDKLAIDLYAFNDLISYDPGTSGYGIDLTNKWNRTSAAHNMVIIDGKKQKPSNAELLYWKDNLISVQANDAYSGVNLKRTLSMNEVGIEEIFEVASENESVIDWVFHCKGTIRHELPFAEADRFQEENGYDQIRNLQKVTLNCSWNISWVLSDKTLLLNFEGQKATEVFIGSCYGNTSVEELGIVIVRRNSKNTQFKCSFTIS